MFSILKLTICILSGTSFVYDTDAAEPIQVSSLNGDDWKVTSSTGNVTAPAVVPGSVYTDLINAKVLKEDPYYRLNDREYRWVAYQDWIYSKTFTVSDDLSSYRVVQLVTHGVDTVADITLNDKVIGKTDNMFKRQTFDIKSSLKTGSNAMSLYFHSPVNYALNMSKQYPYTVPPECPPKEQHGECHHNFIRKEACSFSWDWGPAFPTMGIWKDLEIEAFNSAVVRDVVLSTDHSINIWTITGRVHFDIGGITIVEGQLDVNIPGISKTSYNVTLAQITDYAFKLQIKSSTVEAWWPNGYGNQKLYDFEVTFTSSDGKETSTMKKKFGFRTVELIEEQIDGDKGLSFYFKINNWPIFMKGSNWIPADAFQERITPDYLRTLLTSAKQANMNMLRVWGGGVYESEEFYSICDELGIMIWQDMMFACALYPANNDFLGNVREEITQQIRRLAHHPSIAIWAGNNENEETAAQLNLHNPTQKHLYDDYISLYIGTIREVLLEEDISRPFVPSSPSDGLETQRQGWVAKNPGPQDLYYGDVHHYDYNHDSWDWKNFPPPRFGSEYGLEAWCSMEALKTVSLETDLTYDSEFVQSRQHHPNGNEQMTKQFSMHLKAPTSSDPVKKFKDFIYLTQINQAMGIKTEAEQYIRSQSSLDSEGRGRTMGSLYWQLNDIWQAPTWASMEYGGKWKMLHYYATHFYNRTLISPYMDGEMLNVSFVEDQMPPNGLDKKLRFAPKKSVRENEVVKTKDEKVNLVIYCYSYNSLTPKKVWKTPFTKPDISAKVIYSEDSSKLLQEAGCDSAKSCFFYLSLDGALNEVSNFLFPDTKLYEAEGIQNATITIKGVTKVADNTFDITLVTDNVAFFVWLEAEGIMGRFSDNGFHQVEGKKVVQFYSWGDTTEEALMKTLTVRSVTDIYTS